MVFKGIAKGKTIELTEPLPFREGEEITFTVTPSPHPARSASPAEILAAIRAMPKITKEDTDALEAAIKEGERPVEDTGIFDGDRTE